MSYTISCHLISLARDGYVACIRDRLAKRHLVNADNNLSWYALLTFVMSAAALEALINELCFMYSFWLSNPPKPELAKLSKKEVRQKYLDVPSCLWGKTYDEDESPYRDFKVLVDIRNEFMHYEMGLSPDERSQRIDAYLRAQGLLFYNDQPHDYIVGIPQYFNAKAALWAHNTACQMALKLGEFNRANPIINFDSILSEENFREISPDFWKSLV